VNHGIAASSDDGPSYSASYARPLVVSVVKTVHFAPSMRASHSAQTIPAHSECPII